MLTNDHITEREIKCIYASSEQRSRDYLLHCHNHYEVYFILEGDVSYLAEDNCYEPKAGSLMIFPPHTFHGVKVLSDRPYRRYTLFFYDSMLPVELKTFLLSVFPSEGSISKSPIYFPDVEELMLKPLFHCLMQCAHIEAQYREMMSVVYLEALLGRLSFLTSGQATGSRSEQDTRITEILRYINEHLSEPMSLDQLSGRFFISKNHLNVLFKEATGTTIGDYLINKRITHARQLILQGVRTADAAEASGFSDYSAFFRAYEKILGHTPSQDKLRSTKKGT